MSRAQILKVASRKHVLIRRSSDPLYSFRKLPNLMMTPLPSYNPMMDVNVQDSEYDVQTDYISGNKDIWGNESANVYGTVESQMDPSHLGMYDQEDAAGFQFEESLEESRSILSMNSRLEMTDLCELFLGIQGRDMYSTILAIYMYGALTTYCAVFATALVSFDSSSETHYNFYLFLFFICVVPVSCLELSEQIEWQVLLAWCRGALVVLMLISIAMVSCSTRKDGYYFQDFPDAPYGSPAIDWSGVTALIPLAGYANIFHHSIPALGFPVQNKQELSGIFCTSILILLMAYSLLGSIISIYFGTDIPSSSNTAWSSFSSRDEDSNVSNFTAKMLSSYIVLFPAVDVCSAYPLNAITLGNSILTTFKKFEIRLPSIIMERALNGKETKIFYRLLASCPPFLVAIVCR